MADYTTGRGGRRSAGLWLAAGAVALLLALVVFALGGTGGGAVDGVPPVPAAEPPAAEPPATEQPATPGN